MAARGRPRIATPASLYSLPASESSSSLLPAWPPPVRWSAVGPHSVPQSSVTTPPSYRNLRCNTDRIRVPIALTPIPGERRFAEVIGQRHGRRECEQARAQRHHRHRPHERYADLADGRGSASRAISQALPFARSERFPSARARTLQAMRRNRCSRCRDRVSSPNNSRYFLRSAASVARRRLSISINTTLSTVIGFLSVAVNHSHMNARIRSKGKCGIRQ